MIKLIIAGGRTFKDATRVVKLLERTREEVGDIAEIISGCAKGADTCGEIAADELGIDVKRFPANWDRYGKSAGYRRNEEMAQHGTHLLAFWDGESRGTKHMIDIAKKQGLLVRVEKY